jgi:alpha-2-macroglobulin
MQCYRLKKRKKGGVLEITSAGNTWFYTITPKEEGQSIRLQRWHRFAITPVGQIVARPYYFVWQMGRIIRYPRQAKWYFRNLKYRRESKINNRRHFDGYVAFSQPKYRPGDTLELKAWIETEKGKAWNKPLQMTLFIKNQQQITLPPREPGHFVYTIPLGDSLTIDQFLMFRFTEKNPRKMGFFRRFQPDSRMMSAQVYYEDYVLDEVKYSFTQDKTTYLPDDSVHFHVSARDGNNQPIPDGHYKMVITTTSNERFYAPEVLLPIPFGNMKEIFLFRATWISLFPIGFSRRENIPSRPIFTVPTAGESYKIKT